MTIREIYTLLDRFAPFNLALGWDNCGLQVGDWDAPVGRVLVALDATHEVMDEAARLGAGLILTHHPLLFAGAKQLTPSHPAYEAIRRGIGVVSLHTNYDLAPGGVNWQLARALGLEELKPLPQLGVEPLPGVMGSLPSPMTPGEFAAHGGRVLGMGVRYNAGPGPDGSRVLRRVAVCGGAGADALGAAAAGGCDALLTGEVKHHQYLEAEGLGLTLLDGGHYATERVALRGLADYLEQVAPQLEVTLSTAYDGQVVGSHPAHEENRPLQHADIRK